MCKTWTEEHLGLFTDNREVSVAGLRKEGSEMGWVQLQENLANKGSLIQRFIDASIHR